MPRLLLPAALPALDEATDAEAGLSSPTQGPAGAPARGASTPARPVGVPRLALTPGASPGAQTLALTRATRRDAAGRAGGAPRASGLGFEPRALLSAMGLSLDGTPPRPAEDADDDQVGSAVYMRQEVTCCQA